VLAEQVPEVIIIPTGEIEASQAEVGVSS